jgi:putative flippase GtrA
MTGTELAAIAGILLSLLFSYLPGLKTWYSQKDSQTQSLIMLVLLLLTATGVYGLSCSGMWSFVTCDNAGIKALIEAFIAALVANQAAYVLTPVATTK